MPCTTRQVGLYFETAAILGSILLWGTSLFNGTVVALLRAVFVTGQLADGVHLRTDYTGIAVLDYPLAILVAFFYSGTSGDHPPYQLFLLDAYSTLQCAYVWLYAEALRHPPRAGRKVEWIDRPIIFALLWQCFGAAILLPIYYSLHLRRARNATTASPTVGATDLNQARALTPAFLLGAVVPTAVLMAPAWTGPQSRDPMAHQAILAAFQPSPLVFSAISAAAAWIYYKLGHDEPSSQPGTAGGGTAAAALTRGAASWWICAAYLQAAVISALGHLYVMSRVLSQPRPRGAMGLVEQMYVPVSPWSRSGDEYGAAILVGGPWLFLQWDHIIISLSSLSWVYVLLLNSHSVSGRTEISRALLLLGLLGAAVVLGPGTAVSGALLLRESGFLWEQSTSQKRV